MESWRQVLPDYEIIEWNDENGPHSSQFFRDAVRIRPVNASNYIKLWALFNHGGVFMDCDVEVVRPFNLDPACFIGFQRDDSTDDCINGAVIGSVRGHPYIKDCLDELESHPGDVWPVWAGCTTLTNQLLARGLHGLNIEQTVGDIQVYSKERFYPWSWKEPADRSRITGRTYAVHHWQGSWANDVVK